MRSSRSLASILFFLLGAAILSITACSSTPKNQGPTDDVKNRAARYAEAGNAYFARGQYDQALQLFRQSLEATLSVDDRAGAAAAYNSIGHTLLAAGALPDAQTAFENAIRLSSDIKDATLLFQSRVNLAELYLAYAGAGTLDSPQTSSPQAERSWTDKAVTLLSSALSEAGDTANQATRAIALHDLGTAHARLGNFDLARRNLAAALAINSTLKRTIEMASDHYMIASVYSRQGQFKDALVEILAALELDKEAENSHGIAADLYAAGRISERSGNPASAYGYYGRSLDVYIAVNSAAGAENALRHLIPLAKTLEKADDQKRYETMLTRLEGAGQK